MVFLLHKLPYFYTEQTTYRITRLNLVSIVGTKQNSNCIFPLGLEIVFFHRDYRKDYYLNNSHTLFDKQSVY